MGVVILGLGLAAFAGEVITSSTESSFPPVLGITGAAVFIGGLIVRSLGLRKESEAFNLYSISSTKAMGMTIGQNGLGFVMTF